MSMLDGPWSKHEVHFRFLCTSYTQAEVVLCSIISAILFWLPMGSIVEFSTCSLKPKHTKFWSFLGFQIENSYAVHQVGESSHFGQPMG